MGGALGAPAAARAAFGGPADVIVTARTIHTADPFFTRAQAFAVRGGRFVYVGSLHGARALRGPRTQLLDFGNATILPGLIDAHLHLTGVGLDRQQIDLYRMTTYESIIARIAAAAHASSDPWIFGHGWDQNLWPGRAFPVAAPLSVAVPDRPVLLERVDGHAILVNAKAMQLARITRETREPPGGRIVRDGNGDPTGVFIDNAMELIYAVVPAPSHAQLVRAATTAMRECNRWGLTTIAEPGTHAAWLDAHTELLRAGRATVRNYAMLSDDASLYETYLHSGRIEAEYGGRRWIRTIKLFADGALGSRGAALLAPYSDDSSNNGLLRLTQQHVEDVTQRALRAGFQVCTHAIGDRGNRLVLDAYEAALQAVPVRDHRLRVEHAQVLSPQDIPRFARLGVIPSMQATHATSDMPWAQDRLGPERIRGAYAWRSLLKTGTFIPNGTDAPVEPVSTLRTFHAAITRQNEKNEPPGGWYPDQCMTREETLLSMTLWAARANFQERVLGSIAPGKYGDFVVMDRDWMRVPPEEIMQTKILGSFLGGTPVYDAKLHGETSLAPQRSRREHACCAIPRWAMG